MKGLIIDGGQPWHWTPIDSIIDSIIKGLNSLKERKVSMNKAKAIWLLTLFAFAFWASAYSGVLMKELTTQTIREEGSASFTFTTYSIHARATFIKDGKVIQSEYHAGSVTKLGLNVTFAKLMGNATVFNMTQYNLNLSWISIGNAGTLNTDSTVLPGEWNRTACAQHDGTYNSQNFTATIHPDTGPYTADCFGVNFEDGIGNNALFMYDTFTEVTGIDNTFTIILEFKVSAS